MIQFFNTLSGKTDEFRPLADKAVSMYNCGPTVYDYAHIGNFRAFVFEDLLRRFLEFSGYNVTHIMNLTDVDDKTIAGAQKEGKKLDDYTAQYIEAFNEDLKALNCLLPAKQPRATQKISQMQALIQKLIEKGVAYESGGSVYYRVSKFPAYGKLSKKKLEMNIVGASERVDSDEYDSKEQVTDFVLWKGAKEGEAELGASWDSPWGKGRPGWHIECSAMSMEELGEQFDIHAGGEDLIFPHHENEIAQSEGATGKAPFVQYWLHCKFLLVNGEKMSKSKGNFYTLRDLLAKGYDPMAIRYSLLSTHYRTPLNFTLEGLKEAGEIIKKLDDCYWQCLNRFQEMKGKEEKAGPGLFDTDLASAFEPVITKLGDDLNVAESFADFFEVVREINKQCTQQPEPLARTLENALKIFTQADSLFGLGISAVREIPDFVKKDLALLQQCRANKDFPTADKIRAELKAKGWLVKDGKPGEPSTVKKMRRVWDK